MFQHCERPLWRGGIRKRGQHLGKKAMDGRCEEQILIAIKLMSLQKL